MSVSIFDVRAFAASFKLTVHRASAYERACGIRDRVERPASESACMRAAEAQFGPLPRKARHAIASAISRRARAFERASRGLGGWNGEPGEF